MASTSGIHTALWQWLLGCAAITKLFFNFGTEGDEVTGIATSGDTLIEDYIDGGQLRQYSFELIRFLPATFEPNDKGNVLMMEDVEKITDWIERRSDAGELPALPPGMVAEEISVIDEYNAGYVAAEDGGLAKYMIPLRMTYYKKG